MVTFQFRGRIDSIGELKQGVSAKGKEWKRVDFVCVIPDGRYEDRISLTASNEVADTIYSCDLDEEVAIKGYIYAREYQGRYYNNLEVSEVFRHKAEQAQAPAPAPTPTQAQASNSAIDDLPF